ncbi:MAG: hypothetical protein LW817_07030 [Candidatus Caenarcaniphilales bacterium]|nr:hypothetical protein [Candidatus Caenarcaniphilales bacterium]
MAQTLKLFKNDLDKSELDLYLNDDLIAVDCEMMGLNLHRDRLCLVQITNKKNNTSVIQIERGQKGAPLLKWLFEEKKPLKIFHYARTDICWLKYWLDIDTENFFCTKVASKLARTYTDKHGLKDLVKEMTGKDMNKNQQSSDWGNYDINAEQLKYAANDVANLIPIYHWLSSMLEREDKMPLALECIKTVKLFTRLDTAGYNNILEH